LVRESTDQVRESTDRARLTPAQPVIPPLGAQQGRLFVQDASGLMESKATPWPMQTTCNLASLESCYIIIDKIDLFV
jgi:hypothetical protein